MNAVRARLDDLNDAPHADNGGDADPEVHPDLELEVCGSETGPSVVLVHGAPDRAASFRSLLPDVPHLRVILYDRRGYGRSLALQPARSMLDHAEDLLGVLNRCQPPCVVVAHSFGSNPSMLAATLRPEVFAAMGVWEPPLPWVDWWPQNTKEVGAAIARSENPEGEIEAMYRQLLGDETWEALTPEVHEQRRAEGPAFQVDMASELVAPFEFADMAVPTLVGCGTATSWEHAHGAAWLTEQLPNARLHVVPEAGHFANRTHPKEFAQFVRAVLASREGLDSPDR
jgi:pimeloyl-ACP methyl ester carboxylesterase